MAVFRVHKTENYTVMSNHHLRDANLTLKAKGLLSVILSLPDDWKYSIAGLAAICKEGQSAVKSALQELTDAGYVTVTKLYPNQTASGRIEYAYDIHETPQEPRKQGIENLPLEVQGVENRTQLSTEEPSTEELSTDKEDMGAKRKKDAARVPTREEVKAYVEEKGYHFDPDHFYDYYEGSNWHLQGGKRITSWKQCCVTWEKRETERDDNKRKAKRAKRAVSSEPKVGSVRYNSTTDVTETYKGNGVWEIQQPTLFDGGEYEDIAYDL